jgi:predicted GNAT family acetyltransferase
MSEQPSVSIRDDPDQHRFEAVDESGQVAGVAAYVRHDDRVVITHTVVDDAFEGRGIGSTLARSALDAIRAEGLKVEPRCPFVRDWIERHPDYADLVA